MRRANSSVEMLDSLSVWTQWPNRHFWSNCCRVSLWNLWRLAVATQIWNEPHRRPNLQSSSLVPHSSRSVVSGKFPWWIHWTLFARRNDPFQRKKTTIKNAAKMRKTFFCRLNFQCVKTRDDRTKPKVKLKLTFWIYCQSIFEHTHFGTQFLLLRNAFADRFSAPCDGLLRLRHLDLHVFSFGRWSLIVFAFLFGCGCIINTEKYFTKRSS